MGNRKGNNMATRYVNGRGYVQDCECPRPIKKKTAPNKGMGLWEAFVRFKGVALILLWAALIYSVITWIYALKSSNGMELEPILGLRVVIVFFVAVWFYKNCIASDN